jgi:hypothetical protein
MRRREFISLIGGATAAWPFAARAEQPATPVIGFLHPASPDMFVDRLRGFRQGRRDTGYEGILYLAVGCTQGVGDPKVRCGSTSCLRQRIRGRRKCSGYPV